MDLKKIIADIQEAIAVLTSIRTIIGLVTAKLSAEAKEAAKTAAEALDAAIAVFQESPNEMDDKLIPALQKVSDWLKKISA